MVANTHTALQRVKSAVNSLESYEREYYLSDLADEADMSMETLIPILQVYWVKKDELGIFNIELSEEEELAIYQDN